MLRLSVLLAGAWGAGGAGCAHLVLPPVETVGPSNSSTSGWSEMVLDADWNDIDAAVDVAVSEAEMAVLSKNAGPDWGGQGGDPCYRVFHLKTVNDEPATLEVMCAPVTAAPTDPYAALTTPTAVREPSDESSSVRMTLRATVGRFGDAECERKLLRAVAHRLIELKGVATAPIDP